MSPAIFRKALPLLLLSIAAGCAGGGYEVVGPAGAAGPVTKESSRAAMLDGVEFEVVRADDQIVVHFVNRTGATLRLTGDSTLIDARGRAFAIAPQEIVAGGSGRVLAPPAMADATLRGERRPIASEVRVGGVDEGGILPRRDDGVRGQEPDESRFQWPRGATVRVNLAFDAGGKRVAHVFTLRRT